MGSASRSTRTGPTAPGTRSAPAPTRSSTRPTWTTRRSREMARRGTFYVPTIDHNRYYAEHAAEFGYDSTAVAALGRLSRAKPRDAAAGGQGGRQGRHGVGRGLHDVRREHARAGVVREGGDDPGSGARRRDGERGGAARHGEGAGRGRSGATTRTSSPWKGTRSRTSDAVIRGVRWVMKGGKVVVDHTGRP